jgi:hypothetical protein
VSRDGRAAKVVMRGIPERRTHDYVRNGITSLFAAFNVADDTVIRRGVHERSGVVSTKASSAWKPTSGTGSLDGTMTPGRSCGRRPPTRSSNPWLDIADEFGSVRR